MPKLKHKVTGVTVDVSDEFADANQGAWEPVKSDSKPAAKRQSKSTSE